jgi:hypothetical protein
MKNTYTPEALAKIDESRRNALHDARRLSAHLLIAWQPALKSPRAGEYLVNGVARRLGILQRCIENVFEICPLDHEGLLSEEEAKDLAINLQAFMVHVAGTLDNLAWVVLLDATQTEVPVDKRKRVSLLGNQIVRQHLPPGAVGLLFGDTKIGRWIREYMKTFRDALAHRIPLYVPPAKLGPEEATRYEALEKDFRQKMKTGDLDSAWAVLDEQKKLGRLFPVFAQSLRDPDAMPPVYFHAQTVTDLNTIVEIVRAVCPVPFL